MSCTFDPASRVTVCCYTYPPDSLAEQITDWGFAAAAVLGSVAVLVALVGLVLSMRQQATRDSNLAQIRTDLTRLTDRLDGKAGP